MVEGCRLLHDAGYLLIVVTNEPHLARGTQTLAVIEAMHDRARALLPLDEIVICPHDHGDLCPCRKPQPGMLIAAAVRWGIDLPSSFMIGDRSTDILAGDSAGCTTIFIDGRQEGMLPDDGARAHCKPDASAADLLSAAAMILKPKPRRS